ncbi:MAG TPA: hypothetical protein VM166_08525 [Gemmatimonadaceae bacterium]|nr:hypothetical protein [Gemmatimonadaceae bacterium]
MLPSQPYVPTSLGPVEGFDQPGEQLYPYNILLAQIGDVIGEWRGLVTKEPWSAIPDHRLVDALPEILPKIFRLAGSGAVRIDGDLSEVISQAHGYFRRGDGIPLGAVADEWNYVKRACWKILSTAGVDSSTLSSAVQRLDVLVDDAIGLTLRGYYAPELNALKGKGLERRDGIDERRTNKGNRRE